MHAFITISYALGAILGCFTLGWGYCVANWVVSLPKKMPSWVFLLILIGAGFLFCHCMVKLIHRYPYDPNLIQTTKV